MGTGRGVLAHGIAAEHGSARGRPQSAAPGQHRPGGLPRDRSRDTAARSAQGAGARDRTRPGQGDEALLRRYPARSAGTRCQGGGPERAFRRRAGVPPAGRRQLRLRHAAAQRVPLHRRVCAEQRIQPAGSGHPGLSARTGPGGPPGHQRRQRCRHPVTCRTRPPGRLGVLAGRCRADDPAASVELAGQPAGRAGSRAGRRPRSQRFPQHRPAGPGGHGARQPLPAQRRQHHRQQPLRRQAHRPDGGEPDPRPPRRADAGVERQARPHGHRRGRQPVRPDPLRPARATPDGAPDRPAAAARAACGDARLDLLLVAAPPGAPLRQPHRLGGLRLRRLRRRAGQGTARSRAPAGAGDRRGRLRPDRDLHRQARRPRAVHRRPDAAADPADAGGRDAGEQGIGAAHPAALHAAAVRGAQADVAAALPARVRLAGVEPGTGAGHPPRRRRLGPLCALQARRPRPGDERACSCRS